MRDLGNRMKVNYEERQRFMLTRRMPVIVRVDGKAFHSYTRGLESPFDETLSRAMSGGAVCVISEMQGFKIAYRQSDEVSFLMTDYDTITTEPWFGYNKSKIESVTASIMTAGFNRYIGRHKDAHFDARAFNIPREEVSNYFLWRAKDWSRNSLFMYARSFFSHKELLDKQSPDVHEMLHSIGKNWTTDVDEPNRNGEWITRDGSRFDILPRFDSIDPVINPLVNCDKQETNQ